MFDIISTGKQVTPRVMADDVIVAVTGRKSVGESIQEAIVYCECLRKPLSSELETVWEKIVGVSAAVLAAKGSVRMNKLCSEGDGFGYCVFELRRGSQIV